VEGSCEHGNEPSGSIKFWEFLEWLHNWQLLMKSSAPWVSEPSASLKRVGLLERKKNEITLWLKK
jgi:hypothetical protein